MCYSSCSSLVDCLLVYYAETAFQHAEEMTKRQDEYSKHFKTEIDYLTAEHEAEINRLKASFSQAGTAASSISNHVSPSYPIILDTVSLISNELSLCKDSNQLALLVFLCTSSFLQLLLQSYPTDILLLE